MIENNILSKFKFNFGSGQSTITQLLVTLDEWLYNLDNEIHNDCITNKNFCENFCREFFQVDTKDMKKKQ